MPDFGGRPSAAAKAMIERSRETARNETARQCLSATYLDLIDLALKFPVGEYRHGVIRAAQHVNDLRCRTDKRPISSTRGDEMKAVRHIAWMLRHPVYATRWHLHIGINSRESM